MLRHALMGLLAAVIAMSQARATDYRVDTVASGLVHPWALAFLPDGRFLVTERPGRLRVIESGANGQFVLRSEPVHGLPAVMAQGQAGLFDVLLHPRFVDNGLLYLSFAHGTLNANHLRVVRARFDGKQLLDVTPVFTSQPAKKASQHFGGRMAWLSDGTLVLGMGDGNLERTDAQRLHTHLGKVVRINADGSVPRDNPFVGTAGALPEIYSRGHRNPQGLVTVGGVLYAHEHGARGGDELNRISPGANYGWPITTGGIDYTYARITPYRNLPGIEPPLLEWTPSVAPAGLAWYDGTLFPAWRGSLFVSTLKERSVRRVPMPGGAVGAQEVLFRELGERLRDVRVGPDGAIYLLTDNTEGRVLSVRPK
jgi:glucose/arabinose dehydrogenase